jgi:hypothetical protein
MVGLAAAWCEEGWRHDVLPFLTRAYVRDCSYFIFILGGSGKLASWSWVPCGFQLDEDDADDGE